MRRRREGGLSSPLSLLESLLLLVLSSELLESEPLLELVSELEDDDDELPAMKTDFSQLQGPGFCNFVRACQLLLWRGVAAYRNKAYCVKADRLREFKDCSLT